tara:strand:+ start:293 stop:472 length:180 start_codon:yes stop_codon:yes gene_type:complete
MKIRNLPPIKFKTVSIREDNLKEIDELSKTLLPKVNLSKAQTIARVLDIAKNSLGKKYD